MSSQSSTNRRIQTEEAQIGQRQLGGIMEGRMRRRAFVAGIGGFLAQPWAASAVSPVKRYRVGFLDAAPRERNVNFAAFQQVLLEHGYTEGQNLTFEYRSASGRNASFAELASELVSLQVDVIVTRGTPAALAARWRTLHCQMGPTRHLHRPVFRPSACSSAPRGRYLRNAIFALPNRQFRFRLRLGGDATHAGGCRGKGLEINMAMNLCHLMLFILFRLAGVDILANRLGPLTSCSPFVSRTTPRRWCRGVFLEHVKFREAMG